MNKIDRLISELILDARNGKQGLTDTYRRKFKEVLDSLMTDKNRVIELELSKLKEHLDLVVERYTETSPITYKKPTRID